jgi:hypothetical protein
MKQDDKEPCVRDIHSLALDREPHARPDPFPRRKTESRKSYNVIKKRGGLGGAGFRQPSRNIEEIAGRKNDNNINMIDDIFSGQCNAFSWSEGVVFYVTPIQRRKFH